jgi:hypothetical protein
MAKNDLTAYIEAVKREANGNWRAIYGDLCPNMHQAMDAADKKRSLQVPDPITGAGKTRFSLLKNWEQEGKGIFSPFTAGCSMNGWTLLMECNGWEFLTAIDEVANLLGVKKSLFGFGEYKATKIPAKVVVKEPEPTISEEEKAIRIQKHKDKMVRFWKETYHIDAPESKVARTYLASRGLDPIRMKWVKFHPSAYYYDEASKSYSYHPVISCAVQTAQNVTKTIYRYYLTPEGAKLKEVNGVEIEDGKKPMGLPYECDYTINGCYTLLGDLRGDGLIFMCEGLETGLSIFQQYGYEVPVIVGHTANGMLQAELPEGTKAVIIFADRDKSKIENGIERGLTGQRVSATLKEQLLQDGVKALIALPGKDVVDGKKGADWNDAFVQNGRFPVLANIIAKLH